MLWRSIGGVHCPAFTISGRETNMVSAEAHKNLLVVSSVVEWNQMFLNHMEIKINGFSDGDTVQWQWDVCKCDLEVQRKGLRNDSVAL